jgi:hypothetical protein
MYYVAKKGHRYEAKIQLSGMARMLGSAGKVADKLQDAGFTDVRVQGLGGGVYVAMATWPREDAGADIPELVSVVDHGQVA